MPSFDDERRKLESQEELQENQTVLQQIRKPEELSVELSDSLIAKLNLERKRVSGQALIQHQHQAEQH